MERARFGLLAAALALAAAPAGAQTVLLAEDFEQGLPAGWTIAGTVPILWHVADDGQCGAVTRMAAYQNGMCNYFGGGFGTDGLLASPPLLLPDEGPYELGMRYRLEIDPEDSVVVQLSFTFIDLPPILVATEEDLVGDGTLHEAWLSVPPDPFLAGNWVNLEFLVHGDAVGNTGMGWQVDDVVFGQGLIGTPYCFGDGSGTPCPCGNFGAPGEGCANSTGVGARLGASGSPSVTLDETRFVATGLVPGQPALLFQGANALNGGAGLAFGDGLRCAGGEVVRLGVRTPDAQGRAVFGPGLAAAGGWIPGVTRRFQAWYRDPVGSPCGTGFDLSHGLELTPTP